MTTNTDPGSTTPTDGDTGGDAPPVSAPPAAPVAGDPPPAPEPAPASKDVSNPDSNAQIAAALNRQNEILDNLAQGTKRLNDALVPEDDDEDDDQTAHPEDAEPSMVIPDPPPQPHADEAGVPNGDAKVPGKKGWRRFV